jgi:rod shape-determining protein MreC
VDAQVPETGAKGILVAGPSSILDQSIVQLSYVPRNSLIRPGNRVVTSGEGGYFPRGIPIGEVVDTNSVDYGLYLEARVKLTVNLRQLDNVWVIWP